MILLLALAGLILSQDAVVRMLTPDEAAAFAATHAANAPPTDGDWRVLWERSGRTAAVEMAHIQRQGSMRTVWLAFVGGTDPVPPGSYAVTRLELDCDAKVARPRWFALRAASGANIYGFQTSEGFKPFEATSGGADIARAVCTDERVEGPGFPTHQAFAASVSSGQ